MLNVKVDTSFDILVVPARQAHRLVESIPGLYKRLQYGLYFY
jgi:hypothetical protein